jgi:hypothetical protein
MKKITLLLAMLVVSLGYSQTLPIDFEESDDSNIIASVSDGGTFSIIDDADNTGESVGQFSGKVGGAQYDHINVPLTTSLDIAATNTISFRVKQTTTEGTTSHLFKLQPNGGTGSNQEVAFTTEYDVWKDVSLTYSGNGTYNELIIFFDFNSASVSGTYLIDDIVASSVQTSSPNSVTVATSQAWKGYVNAFNVSDDTYAFGFEYGVPDLRATATATSMTLEPNILFWTASATDAAYFDQAATTQTANKYIEANSFIEDNSLAGEDLTFSGNVSVSDLGSGYTPIAFIKALDPNNDYATVVNKNVSISTSGDFTVSATAAELAAGYIIQYGFSVKGPLADPADTSLGSIVVGTEAPPASGNSVTVETSQEWKGYVNTYNVSDNAYAFGFSYPASDLRATATTTSLTLESNIAIWTANATDAAWFDQDAATQTAILYIEASSYIESASAYNGSDLTFSGSMTTNDIGDGYTLKVFIKALDPNNDYATVVNNSADVTGNDFTISATAAELASGLLVQYGFALTGPLTDPSDTSGSIVLEAPATAGVNENNIIDVSIYPNPSSSNWNFKTGNTVITSVEVFNLLGKRVVLQNNNSTNVAISTQGLTSGIYIARITTEQGTKSVKLIKK